MKVDMSKDGNAWGIATLVVYVGAMGFLLYMYWRDSHKTEKAWAGVREKFVSAYSSATTNGRVDEHIAQSVVEDSRAATESEPQGL